MTGAARSTAAATQRAEPVGSLLELDGLLLEYDSERAGGFERLRCAPRRVETARRVWG